MSLHRVRFDCNGHNAPAYGCSEPGDNSGEYVPADVAREIYEALAFMTAQFGVHECPAVKEARRVIAKARSE